MNRHASHIAKVKIYQEFTAEKYTSKVLYLQSADSEM